MDITIDMTIRVSNEYVMSHTAEEVADRVYQEVVQTAFSAVGVSNKLYHDVHTTREVNRVERNSNEDVGRNDSSH